MKLIFLVVLLFSVARSASRIGVYTSPDCKESSLIGFGWYPYPAYDHKKVSITECSSIWNNQYFDIVTGLPEKAVADFRSDFVYWYIQSGTVINSCNELNANTSGIFGSKPDTCINLVSIDNGYTEISVGMSSCTSNSALVAGSVGLGCQATPSVLTETCASSSGNYLKIVCPSGPAPPVTDISPVPENQPETNPIPFAVSAPVADNAPATSQAKTTATATWLVQLISSIVVASSM